jgi:predicted nucleic acid-binding protein
MSAAKAFFDTNVVLYMYSTADRAKQTRAQDLFQDHSRNGGIVLSTQVVQEFYAAGLRKLAMPRSPLREAVEKLLALPLVLVGPLHISKAIENEERYRISFWDGLILAAAESAGAEVLYTEDLNHGQQYGAVVVRNPFHAGDLRS